MKTSSRTSRLIRIVTVSAIIALSFNCAQAETLLGITTVIDGDTLSVDRNRVRLHGIDAPELRQVCTARDGTTWPCGTAARDALASLLAAQDVRCETTGRDRYRRLLARCWRGSVDVSAWMVERGYALAYRHYSMRYAKQEDHAAESGRGIWRTSFDPPWIWRIQHRGDQVAQHSTDDKIRDIQRQLDDLKAQRAREAGAPVQGKPKACCMRCSKGVPCGNSCIATNKTCRQPPGCAC